MSEPAGTPPTESELLRGFLAGRDTTCPACRYNLRDLQNHRCPECGLPLVLRVNLQEPALAPFLAGVIGVSVCGGFHLLVLAWACWMYRGGYGPALRDMVPLMLGACASVIVLIAWVRLRRRVLLLPNRARWFWAVAAWAPGLALAIWFFRIV